MPIYDAQHADTVAVSTSGVETKDLYRYTVPVGKSVHVKLTGACSGALMGDFVVMWRASNSAGSATADVSQRLCSLTKNGVSFNVVAEGGDVVVKVTGAEGDLTFVARPEVYLA